MVDLKAQYARIRAEMDAAIARVVASAQFIGGEECAALRGGVRRGTAAPPHACGVANGTDALTLALRAYGVGPGDEVVTVANTFIATGEAILLNGARPVFVDVDPETFTMDPGRARGGHHAAHEGHRCPSTSTAIPPTWTAILDVAARHGLPVLEDAAQAHGAEVGGRRAGRLGHARLLQLLPGQEPGRLRRRRAWSRRTTRRSSPACASSPTTAAAPNKYDNVVLGTNSRLDTLQAAVLRVKLRHLDALERASGASGSRAYTRALAGAPGLVAPAGARGRALRLAPVHGPRRRTATPAGPPARRGDRHRRPLPAPDPPAARHGGGGRRGRATCRSRSGSPARCCRCRSTRSCRSRRWSGSPPSSDSVQRTRGAMMPRPCPARSEPRRPRLQRGEAHPGHPGGHALVAGRPRPALRDHRRRRRRRRHARDRRRRGRGRRAPHRPGRHRSAAARAAACAWAWRGRGAASSASSTPTTRRPIEDLDKLLPWLERGFDVVIGSRGLADSRVEVPQALYRRVGSRAFGLAMHALVGLPHVRDTQCGFKFFRGDVARDLFARQRIDGYMFDVEVLHLAHAQRLSHQGGRRPLAGRRRQPPRPGRGQLAEPGRPPPHPPRRR